MQALRAGISALVIALLIPFAQFARACPQQAPVPGKAPTPSLDGALAPLAAQITDNAEKIGCRPGKCKILVTNFVLPGRGSPPFGIQLADALATQLSAGDNPYTVVDRTSFRNLLHQERFSPESQESVPTARWLARKLNANAVIVGEIATAGDNSIELSTRLFNASEMKNKTLSIKGNFRIDLSHVNLSWSDDLPPLPSLGNTFEGDTLYQAGPNMMPSCFYMPHPPYTGEARDAHISGVILLDAIVGTDGHIREPRIVKGLPGGLNEKALETLATWRCKPVTYQGKPVPVVTHFEVNFRLYF
jgi:hypothetical protein